MPKFSAGGPKRPPPPPTQYCSPWDEKGAILLLFKFCIHLHTYPDLQLKWYRVMGQKLRYGRPCTHDLPSTHNWLTQPHIALFLQISTKYLMLTLSWKFGVNRCSFGLTHPAACTQCAFASDLWACPQTPHLAWFPQRGCQSTGLELRILIIYLNFVN